MGCGTAQDTGVLPRTLAECDINSAALAAEDPFKVKENFSTELIFGSSLTHSCNKINTVSISLERKMEMKISWRGCVRVFNCMPSLAVRWVSLSEIWFNFKFTCIKSLRRLSQVFAVMPVLQ